MFRILTLNQISAHGLHRFPSARYTVGKPWRAGLAFLVIGVALVAAAIALGG